MPGHAPFIVRRPAPFRVRHIRYEPSSAVNSASVGAPFGAKQCTLTPSLKRLVALHCVWYIADDVTWTGPPSTMLPSTPLQITV